MSFYDDKQCLSPILSPLFIEQISEKIYLHFIEKQGRIPRVHTKNCWCDALKCDILPQLKVSPLKATCFFFLLCVSSLFYTHTLTTPSGRLLFEQHVPVKSYFPSHRCNLSLRKCFTGLTDSAGAELLPQLWRSTLVYNTDLGAISHRWLHLYTASL